MTTEDQVGPPPGPTATARRAPTLGARLDALGRGLAERHLTEPPWVAPLNRVLDRARQLAGSHSERFERQESARDAPPVAVPAEPHQNLWPGPVGHGGEARRRAGVGQLGGARHLEHAPGEGANEETPRAVATVRLLPVDVRTALRGIAGPGADAMVVRQGPQSDAIARRHRSDAVTIGRDVHVRSGRWAPDTAEGFGLLAHEASHVRAGLNGAPHRRSHPDGRGLEEQEALAHEADARKAFSDRQAGRAPAPTFAAAPVSPGPAAEVTTEVAHARPMTASSQRTVDAGPTGTAFDLEQLRRSVIGDVMRQLRSEFERGA